MTRVFAIAGAVFAVLALAGCGSNEEAPKNPQEQASAAQAQAAKLEPPQPGQYRQTVEFTKFEMPGMSDEHAGQMKQMMANIPPRTYCLTQAEADKGYKDMLDSLPGDSQCSYSQFEVSGGTLNARMECKDNSGATAKATMVGTVSPQGSDVKLDMEQSLPGMGDRMAKMAMHMTTTRLGDCVS
ncbi:DUF3617 domain-containing protein [Novosphingobium mathurense]|uniref:DUF3617 domain-containing protein n=1 Tax=Novosphingobium mathurense TaxID=428990 RepID=A0A1U6HII0_9SPHN|nr:DUF3617 domain-containing protein [Novosphingobium mathurense]SLJ95573.1 Protein of unknown function [Novosphingobium mathurense]